MSDLLQEANKLTRQGFLTIPLYNKVPTIEYSERRQYLASEQERNEWFGPGSNANGIAIAINGTEFAIDTDGKCESLFLDDVIPQLSSGLKDKITAKMHTKTPSGHHRTFKIKSEDFPDGIKEKAYVKLEGHNEIVVKGKKHILVERGPGYDIINDVECLVTLNKDEVDELFNSLERLKGEINAIVRVASILKPYYYEPHRNAIIFSLSGFLHRNNTLEHVTKRIAIYLLSLTNYPDEQPDKIVRTIQDTYSKDPNSDQVSGYSAFFDALTSASPPSANQNDVSKTIKEIENTLTKVGLFTHKRELQQSPGKEAERDEKILDYVVRLIDEYNLKTLKDTEDIWYYDRGLGIFVNGAEPLIETRLENSFGDYEKDPEGNIISKPITIKEVNECMARIKRRTFINRSDFDPDVSWIACEDCMINLVTGETAPFSPKFMATVCIPIKHRVYEPNPIGLKKPVACPKIIRFLHEVMEPDDVETVLDFIAYCLWREYKFHNWVLFNGEGQNGKSTLLRIIERFLGRHNVSSESLQRILEREFSSAQLYSKLANIDADLSTEALKNTGLLKKLTGGDKITAEYKSKSLFEFTNYAKLLFSANMIPSTADMTNAFFRRLIIINFTRQFFGDKDDPYLYEKLTTEEEMSGLLHLCIERLPRVLKEGVRKTTDEVMQKTQDQYIMSMDPVRYFVEKALNKNTQENTRKKVVFESYIKFCSHFKLPVEAEQSFSRKLTEIYGLSYKQFRDNGEKVNCWVGVKVSDWLALEDENQVTFEDIG